jgi:hypothetical protein
VVYKAPFNQSASASQLLFQASFHVFVGTERDACDGVPFNRNKSRYSLQALPVVGARDRGAAKLAIPFPVARRKCLSLRIARQGNASISDV